MIFLVVYILGTKLHRNYDSRVEKAGYTVNRSYILVTIVINLGTL